MDTFKIIAAQAAKFGGLVDSELCFDRLNIANRMILKQVFFSFLRYFVLKTRLYTSNLRTKCLCVMVICDTLTLNRCEKMSHVIHFSLEVRYAHKSMDEAK